MATDMEKKEAPVEISKLSTQQEHAEEIREAIETEHTLTFWKALKLYPKAIGWSMYFSLGVIMLCQFQSCQHSTPAAYIYSNYT